MRLPLIPPTDLLIARELATEAYTLAGQMPRISFICQRKADLILFVSRSQTNFWPRSPHSPAAECCTSIPDRAAAQPNEGRRWPKFSRMHHGACPMRNWFLDFLFGQGRTQYHFSDGEIYQ
jgi:hypothetical protein